LITRIKDFCKKIPQTERPAFFAITNNNNETALGVLESSGGKSTELIAEVKKYMEGDALVTSPPHLSFIIIRFIFLFLLDRRDWFHGLVWLK
jgi:hypothetical protein